MFAILASVTLLSAIREVVIPPVATLNVTEPDVPPPVKPVPAVTAVMSPDAETHAVPFQTCSSLDAVLKYT